MIHSCSFGWGSKDRLPNEAEYEKLQEGMKIFNIQKFTLNEIIGIKKSAITMMIQILKQIDIRKNR
ncbi:MAG: hypothetical protein SNJ70_04025 [Armatimonadota bacterium]